MIIILIPFFFRIFILATMMFNVDLNIDEIAKYHPGPSRKKQTRKIHKQQRFVQFETLGGNDSILYEISQRGNKLLHYDGHKYIRNNVYAQNVYWKCTKWHNGCKARAITNLDNSSICALRNIHNHARDIYKTEESYT